jgi:hypothetical protein
MRAIVGKDKHGWPVVNSTRKKPLLRVKLYLYVGRNQGNGLQVPLDVFLDLYCGGMSGWTKYTNLDRDLGDLVFEKEVPKNRIPIDEDVTDPI